MTALERNRQPPLRMKLLGILVVIASIGLGLVAWSSLYDLVIQLAIRISVRMVELDTIQRAGIIRTARILVMMCGGGIWLIIVVASMGYHSERLATRRSWRILAWTIGIELALIGLDLILF